jgi:hypothetical protein
LRVPSLVSDSAGALEILTFCFSDASFNTVPPNDFSYFEMVNELVQMEPATSFDIELLGQLAAIGIVKGKPFKPDDRMKKILSEAAAVGNAGVEIFPRTWGNSPHPSSRQQRVPQRRIVSHSSEK